MISQTNRILNYMLGGGSLTGLEALNLFGCMRLSARIYNIRRMGYRVDSKTEVHRNESGKYKTFKRYWLVKGDAA